MFCSQFILDYTPSFLLLVSFLLFWSRAVDFDPTAYNLALLYMGLWINIPLALAISQRGLAFLKAKFTRPSGYVLSGAYLVLTAFQYTALVAHRLHPGDPRIDHLQVAFSLLAYYLWFPFCALGLAWLLFRKETRSDWKPVLYLVILIPFFTVGQRYMFEFLVKQNIISCYYELFLLKFKIECYPYFFELIYIWALYIPLLLLLVVALSHDKIRLQHNWRRRILIISLCFAAFFLVRNLMYLHFGEISLATSNWAWNLATAFYPHAALPAILEETVFRGIVQTYLSGKLAGRRGGKFFAILIAALLFGVYHYPFISTTWYQAAFVGFLFGWAYSKTGNLWVPIGLHLLNNILLHTIFVI